MYVPSCDRERDTRVQLLLRRVVTGHVHDTNKLVFGARSVNFGVEQPTRLLRVEASFVDGAWELQDEVVHVLVLLRHENDVAVSLSLAIVTVPLSRVLRGRHNGVCASLI